MSITERHLEIETCGVTLEGDLLRPEHPAGVVVFAHGSGSSRFSLRNRRVARHLAEQGLATLLFDLLTPEESLIDERTRALRFDILLIGARMSGAVAWVAASAETREWAIGLFGASTGAAAALIAAAEQPALVQAVVSRGGRPDLAGEALPRVKAPTLMLVGGWDTQVIELNEQAMARMICPRELLIVPGATHLFEEPGTLEKVEAHAARWFLDHLGPA
ncbi:dienelactone hydrolase family protein [Halomonas ventosae]|uniref:Dienelactone hydrolase n=1 Tax=Halomonas ventosae TaxID=229007 RepID=A0A2T0VNC6_9GAMM|nr:dienelactone hydrolase family protein [Halomonas ventosae]PRY71862.1 dienelactone hydrolase [Halomonas ventosae]